MSSKSIYELPLYGISSKMRKAENIDHTKLSDEKLWKEFQVGNETAFAAIYTEYADQLYSYGMKLINHREGVMDAIQDLFVGMWESRERLSKVNSIKAYLFTSLRRKVIAWSKQRRKVILTVEKDLSYLSDNESSSEQNLIDKEQSKKEYEQLNDAIACLNDRQKEIIYLKYYARLSYDEVAKIMEMDKKAAYNLMARTVERLKKFMGGLLMILFLFVPGTFWFG